MRLIPAVLTLLLAALVLSPVAAHADDGVTIRASEAHVNFPRGVDFRLDAESAASISDVQLQVNTPGQRYGAAIRNIRPSFTPGERVSATWTWQRFGAALPPGVEITYRWRIVDAAGRVTETPRESVRVDDARHQWRERRDELLTVRWYRGDDRFGDQLLAALRDSVSRLSSLQGVDLRYPVTVHVYGSQRELFDALPGVPGWIGGISIPEFDTVIVGFDQSNLAWGKRALTHELAHQLVYQMTSHPTLGSRVPTWLNEGLAVVSEGDTEAKQQQLVDEAVDNDTLPTLRNLAAPFSSRDGHLAGAAYAAAENAVRFLLREYGTDRMRTMLAALGDGASPNEAARTAYGRSLDQLEDAWRTDLGLKPLDRGVPDEASSGRPEAQPIIPPAAVQRNDGDGWILWLALSLAGAVLAAGAAGFVMVRRGLR